jgi:basic membrane protein A and related proteins
VTGRIRPFGLAVLAIAALALGLAACGSSSSSSSGGSAAASSTTSSSSSSSSASSGGNFKVGLVTDIGGLNDRSFNHLAYLGLQEAQSQLGIQGRVLESHSQSDYIPNLTSLARAGNNLVIAVGFLMESAVKQVATAFPKTDFIIIDDSVANIGKLPNEEGLLFHTEQSGYLVGYLAGLYAKAHNYKVISSVGGQKIPSVDSYIAGYQAGAKAADPGITTLNAYSQDFVAQDKCKTVALNQIAAGSKVVFQVAGGCGLGALSAAQEKGVQGIGVDADQSFLGSYILTSAVKKIDRAVLLAIQAAKSGKFTGNTDLQNSLANGGTGYGKIGPAGTTFAPAVANVAKEILSGKISNIPTTVK